MGRVDQIGRSGDRVIGECPTTIWRLVCALLLSGCAAHTRVVVPPKCLHPLTITNFTKSCVPIAGTNDKAICNGVVTVYD